MKGSRPFPFYSLRESKCCSNIDKPHRGQNWLPRLWFTDIFFFFPLWPRLARQGWIYIICGILLFLSTSCIKVHRIPVCICFSRQHQDFRYLLPLAFWITWFVWMPRIHLTKKQCSYMQYIWINYFLNMGKIWQGIFRVTALNSDCKRLIPWSAVKWLVPILMLLSYHEL